MTTTYADIDPKDKEHQRTIINFSLTGHPRFHIYDGDYDADIEYREYIVEKFNLDSEALIEDSNGSTHTVLNADPENFKIHLEFYADNYKNDFAIDVSGKLKYSTVARTAVFFPDDSSIVKSRLYPIPGH